MGPTYDGRGVHDFLRQKSAPKIEAMKAEAIARKAVQLRAAVVTEVPTTAFKAIGTNDLGCIRLIGASAGSPNKLDEDKEFFEKADVIKMAFDFVSKSDRKFNANHNEDEPLNVTLVESFVGAPIIKADEKERMLKPDEQLTDDMEVVGINIEKGNETHWFLTVRPEDPELYELAKAGGIVGASVGALVTKVEV